jgi:hypothetical protein
MKPFTSKHSIAAGSPLHVGGSGKSPLYQNQGSSAQPNRGEVDKNPTSRLVRDGSVIRERATNKIVIGGGEDASGKFHPRTAQQKNKAKK